MAIGTKERPERIANDLGAKAVKGPGAKTGAPGTDQAGKGKGKAKKSMKLKIAIGLVVLLVGGAAAKFTVLAPAPSKASAASAKPVEGPIIQMSEMTLNLTGGQYLRIKIALQTVKGSKPIEDTTMATQLVIDEYSNHTPAELTGDVARTKAKAALLVKLQKAYPKQIMDALYTEFVMTS
jgi:flagellar basal body-associated protein FliL